MEKIRELQKASGTGLKHSGRIGSLITPPSSAQSNDMLVKASIEFVEPGSYHVMLDSNQKRAATLKCGELIPYTLDELNQWKATEYTNGRCVHVFRGFHRRGTNIREGSGSFHYGSGEVFEGRWRNNMRHGLGGLYLPSGYSYEGQFKEDEPSGSGIETFPGGEKYVGAFKKGKPHGHGIMYYVENGSRYEGMWEDGEKHGKGTIFYENGDIFEGHWDRGKRQGSGITTSTEVRQRPAALHTESNSVMNRMHASSSIGGDASLKVTRSYRSQWDKDVCLMRMTPVDDHVPQVSTAPPLHDIVSPLGIELRQFQVVPELWQQVHPAHFHRIKNAFESLDTQCNGELDMDFLRGIWDPNNMETLYIMERAATTVGDDNTLELIEVLTGLFPHLPVSEVRRWVLTDLTQEYLLKLRGSLAEVQQPGGKQDGFYVVSQGQPALTKRDVEINKGYVGGVHITHSMFVRNRLLYQCDDMTFPQMLAEAFPNVWKEFLLRVEVTSIPLYALDGYLSAFRDYDETNCGYLPLEKMKLAQRRFQAARANGHATISMPTTRWEERVAQGIMKHQARWLLGDISLTVAWVKQCDRGRTGHVSFAEVLRQAFPNVPCLHTKERLMMGLASGSKALAEDALPPLSTCTCSVCAYCKGPEFEKARPFTPYADGSATW